MYLGIMKIIGVSVGDAVVNNCIVFLGTFSLFRLYFMVIRQFDGHIS